MPRIAEPDIERVKKETDLLALIQSRGVALARKGKNWTGLCPFHEDSKTPNLIVTPGKGLWRCMACGAAGNAIQFVQRHDGLSFRHAFELLSQGGKAAFESNGRDGPAKSSTVPKLPCPLGEDSEGEAPPLRSRRLLPPAARPQPARPGLPQGEGAGRRGPLQEVRRRLRRPHPRPAHPPRQPQGGRGHPRPPQGTRRLSPQRPRAPPRVPRGARDGHGGKHPPALRPEGGPQRPEGRPPPLPPPPAGGRVQPGGFRLPRPHPLRKRPRRHDLRPPRHGGGHLRLRHGAA